MELKGIRRILDIYENKTKTMDKKVKHCTRLEILRYILQSITPSRNEIGLWI